MKVTKIKVENFRLLKETVIDLEDDLSVILGKNNCGKTSLLIVLDRFLGGSQSRAPFSFDDFNFDFRKDLIGRISDPARDAEDFKSSGISLKVFIEYGDTDDLANIGNKVIMDLEPSSRTVVLAFEYFISKDRLIKARVAHEAHTAEKGPKAKDLPTFFQNEYRHFFALAKKSVLFDSATGKENDEVFTDLLKEQISIDKIIDFKWISARRNVSNEDSDRTLSVLSSRIYKRLDTTGGESEQVVNFKEALGEADLQLNVVYDGIFKEVIDDVRDFGGIKPGESEIKIVSSLQHRELLDKNTTVTYGHGTHGVSLPESYNGLGYMSLISMIFEIRLQLHEFRRSKEEFPADINILFIEEPEVHTHPQMQCVFIKNIKSLLGKGVTAADGSPRKLQTIITTHSSHIVAESDFQDIKYFRRIDGKIISKNLKELEAQYASHAHHYKFLKQYLTLNRSELFFADKTILIEGDTERILLPAMMKKLDLEDRVAAIGEGRDEPNLPLLSQNISIIEVGAHSQIFERFIDFIGIKALIVTDLDSVKKTLLNNPDGTPQLTAKGTQKYSTKACSVVDGDATFNYALQFFFAGRTLVQLTEMLFANKLLKKNAGSWIEGTDGHLRCAFQIAENSGGVTYHARSFEDAFLHINKSFIDSITHNAAGEYIEENPFPSLIEKWVKKYKSLEIGPYKFAKHGIEKNKKPSFAMEILLNSKATERVVQCPRTTRNIIVEEEFSNWQTPAYIKEALQWLKRD